jgi:IS30 family transposase
MNNFGFKSYNSWDKLTKVLVGNVFPKGFFEDYHDKKVADVMTKVNEETREDLDYFCKVLTESYGVKVYRMPDTCVTKK